MLAYTDYKGKKHRNCHTSKKRAKAQIAAIEIGESLIREFIRTLLEEDWISLNG